MRGLAQFEEFATDPLPFSACRARPRIASQIEQLRSNSCFPPKPRAQAFQVMVPFKPAPQRAINKQQVAVHRPVDVPGIMPRNSRSVPVNSGVSA